jgi:hypothetical protein
MATMPRPVTRDKLAAICGNNQELIRFFEQLQQSPGDLMVLVEAAQESADNARDASERALQQAAQVLAIASRQTRAGFGLRSSPDAGGQVLDVVPESLVLSLLPYLPRAVETAQRSVDNADSIIANRVFGAR